ncbi:MAG: IMP dehydrogenase [Ignavibacteria bacterium]|nr:IMP dehydrogenase [Ignavibacteria bacterium]MBK6876880.1 IMP dehydrogenase [Ignavibacteria bacterium]
MMTKIKETAITFDDVLLVPDRSKVLPREVNLKTRLTANIDLNIPILSAAMDTVTESDMAIAMAREGGIGIIHKNMTIEMQANEVDRVKRSESGMIIDPVTLKEGKTIGDALRLMQQYKISGIPIVSNDNKLIGIITNRDLRFDPEESRPVSDLMTKDGLITAPVGTDLGQAEVILQKFRIEKLPVVDKQGRIKGLITFKDIQKRKKFPNACKDKFGRLRAGAAVGIASDTLERVAALVKAGADIVVIDTAHGHSEGVINMVKSIRKKFDVDLIAGNVATAEATVDLIKAGADCVKVGIGAGSICTTRVIAGVGVPQVSAVMECAKAAAKFNVPIISDGGIKQTGDVPKAIAGGADSVMLGGMFAGTEEAPGEKVLYEGRSFKIYRGMGSIEAMKQGSKDRYFQDVEDDINKLVPEGIEGIVPYKGNVGETIYQLIGGLRSAMGYCGAKNIKEMKTKTKFVMITNAGLRESHPHDVRITKEAPNYSPK